MANDPRAPGKKGRLPRDPHKRVPVLEYYLRPWEGPITASGSLPPVTGPVDRETKVADWPMYLNDQIGDCTIAGICHSFSAMAVYAGFPEPHFTDQDVTAAYSAVSGYVPGDPSTDNGADMATVLTYMSKTGIPDDTGKVHKVAAWAAFGDPRNESLLKQTLAATGTVYLGSEIQQSQEDQFSSGEPWRWERGEQPIGGHCYVLQRRRTSGTGVLEMVTWGAVQRATLEFQWNAASAAIGGGEAFYVASEDYVQASGQTLQGLDLQQLMADSQDVE